MREELAEKLRCPVDLSPLHLNVSKKEPDGHIMTGKLQCIACQRVYLVEQGVPHLLLNEFIQNDLSRLQIATVERFGFEWCHFRDWGWLSEYPKVPDAEERFYGALLEHTQRAFWDKSLFCEEDLRPGLLVLDAGCGNGRFTYQAAQTGSEVIGIDLSWGVYSAFEHTRSLPNVHIVRGDLFHLPFAKNTFDRIFSIGVLQHTGNAEAAFESLVSVLRPRGLIAAHVYGQGNRIYEILDGIIRTVTTRLSTKIQMSFARITASIARWLRRGGRWRTRFYWQLFSYINLLPTEIHMCDWWSAPVATHYIQEEFISWFINNKLEIVRTNPPLGDITAERVRRRYHGTITVLGRRPMF